MFFSSGKKIILKAVAREIVQFYDTMLRDVQDSFFQ